MSGPRIRLHIDRLVLDGLPAAQRKAFLSAFEAELVTRIALCPAGDFGSGRRVPAAPPTALAPAAEPGALGSEAARGLIRSITG